MTATRTSSLPADRECSSFAAVAVRVLDGELAPTALDHPHAARCEVCAQLAQSTLALLNYSVRHQAECEPPTRSCAEAVLAQFQAPETRPQRRRTPSTWAGLAVAASLLLGLTVGLANRYSAPAGPAVVTAIPPLPQPPRANVSAQLADAGDALAALTRRTRDQAAAPTRTLWQTAEKIPLPRNAPPAEFPPKLPDVPAAARESLEPVTGTARRALNLFARDFGIAPIKPGKP
jgi:hypothetical protein